MSEGRDWNIYNQLDRIEATVDQLASAALLSRVEGKIDNLTTKLNRLLGQDLSQSKKEKQIMADVKIAQETLDADGDKLSQLATDLKSILDAGNLPEADQSKLQAGLDALTSLDTVQVTPT